MSTKMNIEDVYRLNLSTYRPSDKSYEFEYQYQWTTTNHTKRFIAIREVRLITAPRYLSIEGLRLTTPGTLESCDASCPIVIPSGTTLTNTDFRTPVKDLYTTQIGISGSPWTHLTQFNIGYDPCTTTLTYTCTDDRQLLLGDAYEGGDDAFEVSNDLKAITGLYDTQFWKDLSLLTYGDANMVAVTDPTNLTYFDKKWSSEPIKITYDSAVNRRVIGIHFTKVWNRDPLLLKASFVDLAYDGYLGFTNSVFTPPKRYDIKSNTNRFSIQLFDGVSSLPIILPEDQRDQVIIEAIMGTSGQ